MDGVSYTGAEIYVDNDNRSPFDANLKDFGPRLGFSWQPGAEVVVRGGGGFYYGPSPHMVGGRLANSDGFASVTQLGRYLLNGSGNTSTTAHLCAPMRHLAVRRRVQQESTRSVIHFRTGLWSRQFALRVGQQPGLNAVHHAAHAAHSH